LIARSEATCVQRQSRATYRGNATSLRAASADYFVSVPEAGQYGVSLFGVGAQGDASAYVEIGGGAPTTGSTATTVRIVVSSREMWTHASELVSLGAQFAGRIVRVRLAQVDGDVALRRLLLWQSTSGVALPPTALLNRLTGERVLPPAVAALDVCELDAPVVALGTTRVNRAPLLALQSVPCGSATSLPIALHHVHLRVVAKAQRVHRAYVVPVALDASTTTPPPNFELAYLDASCEAALATADARGSVDAPLWSCPSAGRVVTFCGSGNDATLVVSAPLATPTANSTAAQWAPFDIVVVSSDLECTLGGNSDNALLSVDVRTAAFNPTLGAVRDGDEQLVGALGFSEQPTLETRVSDGWRVEANRVRRVRADGVGSSCATSASFDGGALLRVTAPPSGSFELRTTAQLGDAGAIGVALLVDATADSYYLLAIEPTARCTTLRRRRAGGAWSTLASIDAVWANSSSVAGLSTGDASMFGQSQCPLRTLDEHVISVVLVQRADVPLRIAVRIDDVLVFDYVDLVQPLGEPLRGQAALWCHRSQDCRFGSTLRIALDASQDTLNAFVGNATALQQNPPPAPQLPTASLADLQLDARNACVVNGTCASSVARDSAECDAPLLQPSATAIDAYEALRVGWAAAARDWPRRAPCAAPGIVCSPVSQQGSQSCRRGAVDQSSSLPCCQRLGIVALLVTDGGPFCLLKPLLPDLSLLVVNRVSLNVANVTNGCA
jgi:hypothetical protein